MACITHPSGNILGVVCVVLVAATLKLALALGADHLSIRRPEGMGTSFGVGSVLRMRGHATGYGTAAVAVNVRCCRWRAKQGWKAAGRTTGHGGQGVAGEGEETAVQPWANMPA